MDTNTCYLGNIVEKLSKKSLTYILSIYNKQKYDEYT